VRIAQSSCGRSFALLAVGWRNVVLVPSFVARAEAAGLALGDKAPVRLTSPGDTDRARLVSSAGVAVRVLPPEGRGRSDEPGVAKATE
jgi:hypothetical protein